MPFLPSSATLHLLKLTLGNARCGRLDYWVPARWLPSLVCWQREEVSCELSPGQAIGPHLSVSRKHHHRRLNEGFGRLGRLGLGAHGQCRREPPILELRVSDRHECRQSRRIYDFRAHNR